MAQDGAFGPLLVVVARADGTIERTMTPAGTVSYGTAPVLADLDGDGTPEIIVETDNALNVWRGDGSTYPGWPVTWGSGFLESCAPVVGDVDGDQQPDIVTCIYRNYDAELRAYRRNGTMLPGFPKTPPSGGGVGPAIADIDRDGRNEILFAGTNGEYNGYFDYLWVYDLGGPPSGRIEWGQFGGGPQHQGRYP